MLKAYASLPPDRVVIVAEIPVIISEKFTSKIPISLKSYEYRRRT